MQRHEEIMEIMHHHNNIGHMIYRKEFPVSSAFLQLLGPVHPDDYCSVWLNLGLLIPVQIN